MKYPYAQIQHYLKSYSDGISRDYDEARARGDVETLRTLNNLYGTALRLRIAYQIEEICE